MIAFERMPGNQSPDDDVTDAPRSPGGFGGQATGRPIWVACYPLTSNAVAPLDKWRSIYS